MSEKVVWKSNKTIEEHTVYSYNTVCILNLHLPLMQNMDDRFQESKKTAVIK